MPDDADHKSFFELLARPETWIEDERRLVDSYLRNQRDVLCGWHPRDTKRRAELSQIVRQIEAAIEVHDESHA